MMPTSIGVFNSPSVGAIIRFNSWAKTYQFEIEVSQRVIPAKAGIQLQSSSYRSLQVGLKSSINFNFHSRFHFLSCFSLVIAPRMSPATS